MVYFPVEISFKSLSHEGIRNSYWSGAWFARNVLRFKAKAIPNSFLGWLGLSIHVTRRREKVSTSFEQRVVRDQYYVGGV